jgi:dihydrodipicolinate synthase/N-acetylneuraminate lyase
MTGPRGIWPILYAFFDAEDRLDRALMRRQAELCVAGGAHGMAVLGLATEVGKLTPAERLQVMDWAAEDLAGRLPLAVTIVGETPAAQQAMVRHAASLGAAFVVLQPPPGRPDEAALIRFFGAVADAAPLPVAIQNAPEYLGVGLGIEGLATLRRNHPNVSLLKGEGPAVLIQRTIEALGGRMAVFNGRGGLELPDCLRAGCAGMIPAPDCFDVQVAVFEAMARGDEAEADRLYATILPLIAFTMQGIDHFLCYGKRALALRWGLPLEAVRDRAPAVAPTPFGLACLERFVRTLGRF